MGYLNGKDVLSEGTKAFRFAPIGLISAEMRSRSRQIAVTMGLVAAVAGCSFDESRQRANAGCDAQAALSQLEGSERSRHKNLCMRAAGYPRNTACDADPAYMADRAVCFTASWKFWIEKADLVE